MPRIEFLIPVLPILLAAGAVDCPAQDPDDILDVGILMFPGVYNSEFIAPIDIFEHLRYRFGHEVVRVFLVSADGEVVLTAEGQRVLPDYDFARCPVLDVLVVPSGMESMGDDLEDENLIEFVRSRGADARFVMSNCDGAFVLAQAGLLDGRRATTFPSDRKELARRFPRTVVLSRPLVADGKVVTGVGGAQSYYPALYIVEKIYGLEVARRIGQGLVIDYKSSIAAAESPEREQPGRNR